MNQNLTGILPVLPTPFTPDGAVDEAAMLRVVDFALACQPSGLVWPGFASEVDDLTPEERGRLLRAIVSHVNGRVPIVAGASSPDVADVIARCKEAQSLGIHYAMIQAPKSVGVNVEAVTAFYAAIAAGAPGIAIILQNAPAPRGSDLSPELVLAVARANPAIRYIKEETLPSGPAISALVAGKPAHVAGVIGGGGARYLLEELRRGACGAMPAAELTDVHVAMFTAYQAGDMARARMLYARTLPLLVMQAFSRMRFTKYVLTKRGVLTNNEVRAKIPPLDAHEQAEIDAWLEASADLLTTAPVLGA